MFLFCVSISVNEPLWNLLDGNCVSIKRHNMKHVYVHVSLKFTSFSFFLLLVTSFRMIFLSFLFASSALKMCLINTPFVSDVARMMIRERTLNINLHHLWNFRSSNPSVICAHIHTHSFRNYAPMHKISNKLFLDN